MRTQRSISAAVMAGLFVFASLAAGSNERAPDDALRALVANKLADAELTNGGGPSVVVVDGKVTLEGTVRSAWAKRKAVALAMDVDDVVAVEDRLAIAFAENDATLSKEIAKAVRRYPFFTVYDDVTLAVEEGRVVLAGVVTMPFKSDEIGERVEKVMGVQSVTNEIRTLPTSINDQRLRSALVYRIYGDSLFREYAFRVNPPIHVIVERGRVVLTGAVRSKVEKRKAEHIARSTFGVFSVENRLSVGS